MQRAADLAKIKYSSQLHCPSIIIGCLMDFFELQLVKIT